MPPEMSEVDGWHIWQSADGVIWERLDEVDPDDTILPFTPPSRALEGVYEVTYVVRGNLDYQEPTARDYMTRPEPTPVGESGQPIFLDRCWREGCGAEIPKDDEVGLCKPCVEELRNL